jgi:hypothetical protein
MEGRESYYIRAKFFYTTEIKLVLILSRYLHIMTLIINPRKSTKNITFRKIQGN